MRGAKYEGKLCTAHPRLRGLRFRSSSICTACATERQRLWRSNNPQRNRHNMLLRKYGVTFAQFRDLLAAQGGKCAVCRGDAPGGSGDWHVDHDHKTGRVRGVLCSPCNTGLGMFGDDPRRLEAGARYLRARP